MKRYMVVIEINKSKLLKADSIDDAQLLADQYALRYGGEVMDLYEYDE